MTTSGAGGRGALVARELLQAQMEPIHLASSAVAALSLLPAIQVAWADGVIQERERELILKLAAEQGLLRDAAALARIHRWLEAPPTEEETRDALAELRGRQGSSGEDRAELERIVGWAHEVARADGGVLGFGAVSSEERSELERLESELLTDSAARQRGAQGQASSGPGGLGGLTSLQVMRDLLVERLTSDTEHLELVPPGAQPQWPQPSPRGADRMPPAVFGIPESDYRDYMERIVGRYVRTLTLDWRDALRVAAGQQGVARIDDAELCRLLIDTPFSRFLVPATDARDVALFAHVPGFARGDGALCKADFEPAGAWTPLPGLSLAETVGLFRLDGDRLSVLAIAVSGRVFTPRDGASWARARYFLLQACSVSLVVGAHPLLHFPMDSVVAVSREALPAAHPVARLVEAHAYLQLPLNYGVCWSPRSVAHNHQHEIYTPFPMRREDVFHGVSAFYRGIEGNSGYPGFRYPLSTPAFPGAYCRFLGAYYEVVLAFCRRVAAACAPGDADLARWGTALHGLLPGFPNPEALRDREVLARALAGFVHAVSIWHSADHHLYSLEPVNKVPQRLRIPAPAGGDAPVPLAQWVRPVDLFRQELARRMFYAAITVRPILDVDYGFDAPDLTAAARDFHAALRACDAAQPRRYIALEQIACSIQF